MEMMDGMQKNQLYLKHSNSAIQQYNIRGKYGSFA